MNRQGVLVHDARADRYERICRLVGDCGASAVRYVDLQQMQHLSRAWVCRTALVGGSALGMSDRHEIETIRSFRQAGFSIICYQDDLNRWPIGVQCRAFLAGCSHLLDCSAGAFEGTLREVLRQRLREAIAEATEEQQLRADMLDHGIIGSSLGILGVFRLAKRIAGLSNLSVLITGESGTGKELIANAIHRLDASRRSGPFVPINCAAISRELAESELFGHRSGAFTGAARQRKGLFRAADGGVIFLDEVAELDERLQSKLLRVLQEQRVLGVGDEVETPVDVRVISATNADLRQLVAAKKFRADLFNRLNAVSLHLPPLRERGDDVRLLIAHFLHRCALLRGASSIRAGEEFIDALVRLPLPGNARELENLIRWTVVNKSDDDHPLSLGDLPPQVWEQLSSGSETRAVDPAQPGAITSPMPAPRDGLSAVPGLFDLLEANSWNMSRSIASCECLILKAALERAGGNQSRTAELLGITPRSVYSKLRKHHLHG